ncbi:hypothetical protein F5Y04DRAFT_281465 [Hypomontagnella monticulosa]|nr:hypothetical protein F5Y04DRAFT_281465 [Hypomontagnella monticulosa]
MISRLSTFLVSLLIGASAGQEFDFNAPAKVWITHLSTFGVGCPPTTAEIAPDFTSFTLKYDLKKLGKPLVSVGPDVPALDAKLDCATTLILRVDQEEGNHTLILLDSERKGFASLEEGATGTINSMIVGHEAMVPGIPEPISEKGPMDGAFSSLSPAGNYPFNPDASTYGDKYIKLPGRDTQYIRQICPNDKDANAIRGWPNNYPDGQSVYGTGVNILDRFEVEGTKGAIGTGDEFTHTVHLHWYAGCHF